MSVFSFSQFPALYLSSIITNSFGIALCANVEKSDSFIKGTIIWFVLSIIAVTAFGILEYATIDNFEMNSKHNIYTVLTGIITFINYVAIFALYFNDKYELSKSSNKTSSSMVAITGVFFTMFVLSIFYDIFVYVM